MQSDQVLLQILKRLEAADSESLLFRADEVCEWPDELFSSFVTSGLIKPASPVKITGCTGCEENCLMPVNVLPAAGNWPARFFISCDKLEDVGRIAVDATELQQYQINAKQFAQQLAKLFGSDHPCQYARLQKRLETMYIDELDGVISQEFFEMKTAEWRKEQESILTKIEKHQNADQTTWRRVFACSNSRNVPRSFTKSRI